MPKTARAKFRGAMRSTTIWLNTVALSVLPFIDTIQQTLPGLKDQLPSDIYKALGIVVVVGNILLRFKTNTDLKDK